MAIRPGAKKTSRCTASRRLATTLIRQLLEGRYPSGGRLPTERDMAQQYQVSRHVVREALKHLEALDMIEIRQGSGVYIKAVLHTGGMELFEYLLFNDQDQLDGSALRDMLVFCRLFVPNVLRLAAENRTAGQLEEMRTALAERPVMLADTSTFVQANMCLLRIISRATHNMVYQLLFNNVGRILSRLRTIVPLDQFGALVEQHELEELVRAIEDRDAELAGLLAQRMAEHAQDTVNRMLTSPADNAELAAHIVL